MLANNEVCACLAVKDMAIAAKFYEETLGLTSDKKSDYGTFYKAGNGGIFVYPSGFAGTNQATAAAWSVDDAAAEVEALKAKGVVFEHYDLPGMTLEGDLHLAGPTKSAWFKDPDGNILNIVEGM